MNSSLCQTCYAVLPQDDRAISWHDRWHANISKVAIESTERIEELMRRVQELEAGYGDQ